MSITLPATPNGFEPSQQVLSVQRGDVTDVRTFPGKVVLDIEQDLFFGDSGRVQVLHVESGDTVSKGDLIAELDARDLVLDLELAENAVELTKLKLSEGLEIAAIELENAQRSVDIARLRLQALEGASDPDPVEIAIQQIEVERAQSSVERLERGFGLGTETDIAQLTSEWERAKIALRKVEASLGDRRIAAPFDGEVRLFDAIEVGTALQAYEPVAKVVDPATVRVDANLVSEDLSLLHEGMSVQVAPINRQGTAITGQVARLPQPFGTGTGTLTVIALSGNIEPLRPGMSVEITAELAKADETLWVPPEALRGFSGNHYVEFRKGDDTIEAPVTVGLRNDRQVEILSGLQEDDQVIASP